ncbi:MAG: alpha/beta hydrolase [Mesorhizobium sp.]|uniref:alpha/beta fold hydrolase n=1 Tax=Mesorhizobium sp. TaxID=1871066 RepID=UPI001ACBE70A|nr:alpha/beta hydrolase [Mesorhizobium sp.]MBN9220632.1 alpha/beta hydrolase [Mesorhizobium sp.]
MPAFPAFFRRLHIVAVAALGLASLPAVASADPVKNVILVHGAWGDGSNWSKVIPILAAKGLNVTAVQLPLTSLADDAAAVKRAIALADGPVVLAGHSYGGSVITEAGNDPKVSALVYVAAFAPDAGQSAGSLNATVAPSPLAAEAKPDAEGFISLSKTGVYDDFAQDVTPAEKQLLYVAQSPTNVKSVGGNVTSAAWHDKPCWYIVAAHDRAIQPALEAEMAKTIKAKTTTVEGSHMIMLSKASAVAAVIEQAAH